MFEIGDVCKRIEQKGTLLLQVLLELQDFPELLARIPQPLVVNLFKKYNQVPHLVLRIGYVLHRAMELLFGTRRVSRATSRGRSPPVPENQHEIVAFIEIPVDERLGTPDTCQRIFPSNWGKPGLSLHSLGLVVLI
jgi:hypothetical protein